MINRILGTALAFIKEKGVQYFFATKKGIVLLALFLILIVGSNSSHAQSTSEESPGGVSDSIVVWLRSEAGTNTTTDGEDVTVWNNSASNPVYNLQYIPTITTINGVDQNTPTNSIAPSYESNSNNLLNFHPIILFENSGDGVERLFTPNVNTSESALKAQTFEGSTMYIIGSPKGQYNELWGSYRLPASGGGFVSGMSSSVPLFINKDSISYYEKIEGNGRTVVSKNSWFNNEVALLKMTIPKAAKESHSGQVVQSTGVTGLTATLAAGSFENSTDSLVYTITGTPSGPGTATFAIDIGGKTCLLTREVGGVACPTSETLTIQGAPTGKICGGSTFQLSSSMTGDSYAWTATGGATIDDATSATPNITFPKTDVNVTIGLKVTTSGCSPEAVDAPSVTVDVDEPPAVAVNGIKCLDVEVTDHDDDPLSQRTQDPDVFTGLTYSVGSSTEATSFSWSWLENPGNAEIKSGGDTHTATVDFKKEAAAVGTYILQVEMGGFTCGRLTRTITIDIRDKSCGCPTKVVEVISPITGRIWMDRNLGDKSKITSASPGTDYGCLFQYGRNNDGHADVEWTTSGGTYKNGTTTEQSSDGNSKTNKHNTNSWTTLNFEAQKALWDGVDAPNNPCPSSFRLPTTTEWDAEFVGSRTKGTWNLNGTTENDWLTFGQYGYKGNGITSLTLNNSYYSAWAIGRGGKGSVSWHNALSSGSSYSGNSDFDNSNYTGYVFPVRCIKDGAPVGIVSSLDLSSAVSNGTLVSGVTASDDVSSVISYTGGNGGTYDGQSVESTGITGLTATLDAGSFADGSGALTYTITGTPSGHGIASFVIKVGGQTITLTRAVTKEGCPTSETLTIQGAPTGKICGGSAFQLSSSMVGDSYAWTATGGATIDDATSATPNITFPKTDVNVTIGLKVTTSGCSPEAVDAPSVTVDVDEPPAVSVNGVKCLDVEVTDHDDDPLSQRTQDPDVFTGLTYSVGSSTEATSFSWSWLENPGNAEIKSGGDTHTATVDFKKEAAAVGTYILQVEMGGFTCGRLTRTITIDIRDKSCGCPTKVVEVISPITGRTWMDRNLGDKSKITSASPGTDYGCLFQYGRNNDGHADVEWTTSGGTYKNGTTTEQSSDGNSKTNKHNTNSWTTLNFEAQKALWDGVDAPNNPCPSSFRLPTTTEWDAEFVGSRTKGTWNLNGTTENDWLTFGQYGYKGNGITSLTLNNSYYSAWAIGRGGKGSVSWHNALSSGSSYSGNSDFDNSNYTGYVFPVRCIKDGAPVGIVSSLDLSSVVSNGTLVSGVSASDDVSSVISYTGGNGGTYDGQSVESTGITGLTATLDAGSFADGSGALTYTITGTPSGHGIASFVIKVGGQTITLTRAVTKEGCPTSETLTIQGAPTGKICGGSAFQLSSSMVGDSYAWTATGGATIDDATSATPNITFPKTDVNVTIGLKVTTSGCSPEAVDAPSVTVDVDEPPAVSVNGVKCLDVEVTDHDDDPLSQRTQDPDVFTGLTYSVGSSTEATSFSWSWLENPGNAEIKSGGDTHTATVDFKKEAAAVGTYILQVEMGGFTCGRLTRTITIDIRDKSCGCPTKVVEVISPITGRTWMDRNLGDKSKITSASPGTDYGCLFQYGRNNDGHADVEWTTSGGTYKNGTTTEQSSDGNSKTNKHNTNNWTTLSFEAQKALWDGVDAPNNPCPSSFRLPTTTEWDAEFVGSRTKGTWNLNGTTENDWLTFGQYGYKGNGITSLTLNNSYYSAWAIGRGGKGSVSWHNALSSGSSYSGNSDFDNSNYTGYVFPVRCIKDGAPVGIVSSLDLSSVVSNGTLVSGVSASDDVSSVISYTGGNGGTYDGQSVESTGITGLTATLDAGSFADGSGALTYTITGTPSGHGIASFVIKVGGQTITLTRAVTKEGCPTSETLTIQGAPTGKICGGSAFQLSSSMVGDSYAWTATGGATIDDATSATPNITFPKTDVNVTIGLKVTTSGCSPEAVDAPSVTVDVDEPPAVAVNGIKCLDVEVTDHDDDPLSQRTQDPDVFTGLTYSVGSSTEATSFSWSWIENPGNAEIKSGGDTHTATVDFKKEAAAVGTYILQVEMGGFTCGRLTRTITIDIRDKSCGCPTKLVEVISPITGRTWMDRNLGDKSKITSASPGTDYGCLFQYGRNNDGHADVEWTTSGGTYKNGTTTEQSSDGNSKTNKHNTNSWTTLNFEAQKALWDGVDAPNNPCPSSFRLPTTTEWDAEFVGSRTKGTWNLNGTTENDWLTFGQYGYKGNGITSLTLNNSYYSAWAIGRGGKGSVSWHNALSSGSSYSGNSDFDNSNYTGYVFPVRCIKDGAPVGIVSSLDLSSVVSNGTLVSGVSASDDVSSVISYTGGNGGTYDGQSVESTGITGLTATLDAGNFADGSGALTYTITGTPSGHGIASFVINVGGQTITLTRAVTKEGCPSSETLTIQGAPTGKICGGSAFQLSSSMVGDSYAWTASGRATMDDATSATPTITFPNADENITIGLEVTTQGCSTVNAPTITVDVDKSPNIAIEGPICKDVEVTDHADDPLSQRQTDPDVFTGLTYSVGTSTGSSSFSWSWAQNPGDFAEIKSGGNTHTVTVDFTKSKPAVGTYILQATMEGATCGTFTRTISIEIRDNSCNCATKVVEVTSPITGKIWMDRDLGARSRLDGTSPFTDFGCLFEFGRKNDGHANVNWTNASGGTYTNGVSTVQTSTGVATHSKHNTNAWTTLGAAAQIALWNGVDAPNNPCPAGFRIPTDAEWKAEFRGAISQSKQWALEGTSPNDWFTSRRYGNRNITTTSISPTTNAENAGLWFGFWSIGTIKGSVFWHVQTTSGWTSLYGTNGFDATDWSGFVLPVRCIKN